MRLCLIDWSAPKGATNEDLYSIYNMYTVDKGLLEIMPKMVFVWLQEEEGVEVEYNYPI